MVQTPPALQCGIFWSALDLGTGSAWVGGVQSVSENLLRRVDCRHLSRGGAIVAAGFREFKCRGHPMTVTTRLQFCGSGTVVGRNGLSQHAWPSSERCCWWFKLSCLKLDFRVWSPVSTHSSISISWTVLSSCVIYEIWDIGHLQYNAWRQRAWESNIWWTLKINRFHKCKCK